MIDTKNVITAEESRILSYMAIDKRVSKYIAAINKKILTVYGRVIMSITLFHGNFSYICITSTYVNNLRKRRWLGADKTRANSDLQQGGKGVYI